MVKQQPIDPIDKQGIKNAGDQSASQLTALFLEIMKANSARFGTSLDKNQQSVIGQAFAKTLSNFPVRIARIAPMRMFQPTKFYWELIKIMKTLFEEFQESIRPVMPDYDFAVSLQLLSGRLDNHLLKQFPTEFLLWDLMDQGKTSEQIPLLKQLAIERKDAQLDLQVELLNWRQQLALDLGDIDLFFEGFSDVLELGRGKLKYSSEDSRMAITELLVKKGFGLMVNPTTAGLEEIQRIGHVKFMMEQMPRAQFFLVTKILHELFEKFTIKNRSDFENFLKNDMKKISEEYSKSNKFVDLTGYVFQQ